MCQTSYKCVEYFIYINLLFHSGSYTESHPVTMAELGVLCGTCATLCGASVVSLV